MALVVALKFDELDMPHHYLPGPFNADDLKVNDFVVAPRENGLEVGYVAALEYWAPAQVNPPKIIPVLARRANPPEIEQYWLFRAFERRAYLICKAKVAEHALPMKIATARFDSNANKMSFRFTSERRVDFRALVRDLAALLRCRIELWQIGVREEARELDGYGVCGLRTCCSTWIKDFKPINLKMAKAQEIDLPPTKLTGQCGRLLCCLDYEVEAYRQLGEGALPRGTAIVAKDGLKGVVIDRNLIANTYLIAVEGDGKMATVRAVDIVSYNLPEHYRKTGRPTEHRVGERAGTGWTEDGDTDGGFSSTTDDGSSFRSIEDTVEDDGDSRGDSRDSDRDRRGASSARRGGPRRPPSPPPRRERVEDKPEQDSADEKEDDQSADDSSSGGRPPRRRRPRRRFRPPDGGGGSGGASGSRDAD